MEGLVTVWMYLLLLAFGIWFCLWQFLGKKFSPAWKVGLFLALYDFAFETAGGYLGFWTSQKSVFPLGFVPLEVFFIALMAGMAYNWVIPAKLEPGKLIAVLLAISVAGALIEALLVATGFLVYSNWNSLLAVPAYAVSFGFVHMVDERVSGKPRRRAGL